MHLKAEKRMARTRMEKESDTKRHTLELYQKVKSIEKVAALRELTVSTVETHLAFYIQKGKLNIDDILTPEEIAVIRRAINTAENRLYSSIKLKLGDDFTYGQIRLVMADLEKETAHEVDSR